MSNVGGRTKRLGTKQNRMVIRTVRLTKELDEILAEDAHLRRTNLNALISTILTKYAEWDRYAERLSHISVPTTLFRDLLDLITDEDALATRTRVSANNASRGHIPECHSPIALGE